MSAKMVRDVDTVSTVLWVYKQDTFQKHHANRFAIKKFIGFRRVDPSVAFDNISSSEPAGDTNFLTFPETNADM